MLRNLLEQQNIVILQHEDAMRKAKRTSPVERTLDRLTFHRDLARPLRGLLVLAGMRRGGGGEGGREGGREGEMITSCVM